MSEIEQRKSVIGAARRVVIKIGSAVLVDEQYHLREEVLARLAGEMAQLRLQGREIAIVSSGAMAAGIQAMGQRGRPQTIPLQQAAAAVGQSRLIGAYARHFEPLGIPVAQILLTQDDLRNRRRYLNARNALTALFAQGVVPIINENDSVVVNEIKFGDNDTLSAQVAPLVEADLLILLSTVDGLHRAIGPDGSPQGPPLETVEQVDEELMKSVNPAVGAAISTGGMTSKLRAVQKATHYGIPVAIASGLRERALTRVTMGEPEGTLFLPHADRMNARAHWIAYTLEPAGRLTLDAGAVKALREHGRSLLPSGITAVTGRFELGELVVCEDGDGNEIARGLVGYSSEDIERIKGCQSAQIESRLGYRYDDWVIHRDNLVRSRERI